jgi:hypothetical protein
LVRTDLVVTFLHRSARAPPVTLALALLVVVKLALAVMLALPRALPSAPPLHRGKPRLASISRSSVVCAE